MLWQVVKSATPIRELQAHPETSTASAEVHADDRFYLWPYALRPWLFWPGLLAALYLWLRLSAADWPSLWAPSGALALSFVAIFVALPILVYRLGRTSVLNDTFKHLPASSLQWMRGVAKWRSRALFKTHALLDWIRLRLYCAEPASAVGESCRLTSKSDSNSADDRTPSLLSLVDLRKRAAKWGKETWSKVAEAEPWLRKAAAEWVKEFANRFGRYAPFCAPGRDSVLWYGARGLQGSLLILAMRELFQSNDGRSIIFDRGYHRWLLYVWLPVWNGYVALIAFSLLAYYSAQGTERFLAALFEIAILWTLYACLFLYRQATTAQSWLDVGELPSTLLEGIPLDLQSRIYRRSSRLASIKIELAATAVLGIFLSIAIQLLG
jgi:hypothetical protein